MPRFRGPDRASVFKPGERGLKRVLGELETRIMELVWSLDRPVRVREVHGRLARRRSLDYHTVTTVMVRLCRKGLLRREKRHGVWHYRAALGEAKFREWVARDVLAGLYALSKEATLASFVELVEQEDPETLSGLRELIERRTGKRREP